MKISHDLVEECSGSILKLKEILELKRDYDQNRLTLKEILRSQKEYWDDLKDYTSKIAEASKTIKENDLELEKARTGILKLKKVESELAELKGRMEECSEELAD